MIKLHPTIQTIQRSYGAWVSETSKEQASEQQAVEERASVKLKSEPAAVQNPPAWVAALIHRQVAAQPTLKQPEPGDIIVMHPSTLDRRADDVLPALVLLDSNRGNRWAGWLVGAHPDYAGSQDLILEERLIKGGKAPAPLAAMVETWNRVHFNLSAEVLVMHQLTEQAVEAVRELSVAGVYWDSEPSPGRMQLRHVAAMDVVTGTPYGRDDPRNQYLLLSRSLARCISEPMFRRKDYERDDDDTELW